MLGMEEFGCARLLAVDILGLRLLGELCDGMLLAVDGLDFDWLLLELLEDCDCDWDCDGELEELEDCCGFAGGCCWVCWLLQPPITADSTITETSERQPVAGDDPGVNAFAGSENCCAIFRSVISFS